MNLHLHSMAALAAMLLLTACASAGSPKSEVGNTERKGFVGGIMLAEGAAAAAPPKVIVTSYALSGAAFTQQEALVTYGSGGLLANSGEDYRVELVNASERILQSYSVTDPRKFVVERQGIVENPTGVLTARFRFDPSAALVRVRDANSMIVAETNVRSLIVEFCRRAQGDPDCRGAPKTD
jgi:hypothetical protein